MKESKNKILLPDGTEIEIPENYKNLPNLPTPMTLTDSGMIIRETPSSGPEPQVIEGDYIVQYHQGVNFEDILNDYPEVNQATNLNALFMFYFHTEDEELLDRLEEDSRIKRISYDVRFDIDPMEMAEPI